MKKYKIELDGIIGKEDSEYEMFLNTLKSHNLILSKEPSYKEEMNSFTFEIQGSKKDIINYLLQDYQIEESELSMFEKDIEEV